MNQAGFSTEKRNYRIPEFLAAYGICRTKFYMEVAAGRLKIVKCGRTTLIPREAAEAWQSALAGGSHE